MKKNKTKRNKEWAMRHLIYWRYRNRHNYAKSQINYAESILDRK